MTEKTQTISNESIEVLIDMIMLVKKISESTNMDFEMMLRTVFKIGQAFGPEGNKDKDKQAEIFKSLAEMATGKIQ